MKPARKDKINFYKKARFVAMLWTLLILLLCLTPSREIPKVDVPFIDKWTHLVMFGGFSFLWLLAAPAASLRRIVMIAFVAAAYGGLIEVLQGTLTALGRSMELLDFVADSIGGIIGVGLYWILSKVRDF